MSTAQPKSIESKQAGISGLPLSCPRTGPRNVLLRSMPAWTAEKAKEVAAMAIFFNIGLYILLGRCGVLVPCLVFLSF